MSTLIVYVPNETTREGVELAMQIAAGSGIVARDEPPMWAAVTSSEIAEEGGRLDAEHYIEHRRVIYFEGNVYGVGNMRTYADRVYHAADRLVRSYPTSAMMVARGEALLAVGEWDTVARVLRVDRDDALAVWLGLDTVPASELQVSE